MEFLRFLSAKSVQCVTANLPHLTKGKVYKIKRIVGGRDQFGCLIKDDTGTEYLYDHKLFTPTISLSNSTTTM